MEVFETHSDSPQYGRSLNRRASKQSQGLPSCLLGTLGGEPAFKNIILVQPIFNEHSVIAFGDQFEPSWI